MLFYCIYPLLSVVWILSPEVPNTIIHADIKSAFIKVMGL